MIPAGPVQDKTITLNGLRFHYRDWQNESAPVLVVLHGFSSTSYSWDGFAKAMQDGFRVLVLDQRGHGETEWATDYRVERWVEDIDAFARALQLAPFAILGHSMGGRNAWFYAAAHPETVTKLVLADMGPQRAPAVSNSAQPAKVPAHPVFDDVEAAIRVRQEQFPTVDPKEIRYTGLANLIQREDSRWTVRWDPVLGSPELSRRFPDPSAEWAALQRITCPTLLVLGANSDEVDPGTAARMVREMLNCRVVELPNAGHYLQGENLSGLVSAVRSFLQE